MGLQERNGYMDGSIICSAFGEKRQEIQREVKKLYVEIAEDVKKKPAERVAKEITIAEASRLNAYCQSLEQTLRREICGKMTAAGAPDNEVNILWARARRKAGTAQIQLCKEEKLNTPPQDTRRPHEEKKTGKQGNTRNSGHVLLASGAAVEIISWIFIPGMGKFAAVVKGAGLVVMAAGAYMTYEESKEKPRIRVSEEALQKESGETGQIIDSICEKQCQLNTSILCTWLDTVRDAVLQECGIWEE